MRPTSPNSLHTCSATPQALPARLPDFYDYLLTYPNGNQQMWKIRSTGRSEIRIEANPTYRASHRAGETR
jgi:hypothetical protein